LHLGNIVAIGNKPVLFDALEFDDQLATIDVLYDLAFLIMDLDSRGYRRAANLLLNRYLAHSPGMLDLYGLAALPLFLALRAAIRAMVALQRGHGSDSAAEVDAWRYLDRALGYLQPRIPHLVAIGGCSGTGKSTLARNLAPTLGRAPGAIHISSDVERKGLAGVPELQRLAIDAYTPEMTEAVYRRLQAKAKRILRSGSSVVVDATFLRSEDRSGMADLARRLGVRFNGLWLTAPQSVAADRVESRRADVSDATPAVVDRQFATLEPPIDWITISAGGSQEQTLAVAQACLGVPAEACCHAHPREALQASNKPLFCAQWQLRRSATCRPTSLLQRH
jgi:predicted kinase